MIRKQILGTGFATLLVSVGTGAQAQQEPIATLTQLEGKVLVNQGEETVPAQAGMSLRSSDRVLTLEDATALVVYKDGCGLPLEENSQLTLMSVDECTQGVAAVSEMGAFEVIALGAGAGPTVGATALTAGAFAGLGYVAGQEDTEDPAVSPVNQP
jgi:hypothetical protein